MTVRKANNTHTAFTIIEVLLVIFLIGLVAGLFAVNFDILLTSMGKKRPEQILHNALCESRYQSIQEYAPVYLSFDEKKSAFLIFKDIPDKPLVQLQLEEGIGIVFDQILPNQYRGGRFQEPDRRSKEVLERMAFFPDGSSTPAIITLSDDEFSLKFKADPVSCNLILIE